MATRAPKHDIDETKVKVGDRKKVAVGVPAVLGAAGVERVIEMQLNDEEKAMLDHSADAVKSVVAVLGY